MTINRVSSGIPSPASDPTHSSKHPVAPARPGSPAARPSGLQALATRAPTLPASSGSKNLPARGAVPTQGKTATPQQVGAEEEPHLPVAMKQHGRPHGFPAGASPTNVKMAQVTAKRFGENGNKKAAESASVASYDETKKQWMHKRPDGNAEVANGKYTFATMSDGSIRLGAPENGSNAHATLTGNSMKVRYAGEAEFDQGKLKTYSNGSGTYVPPGVLRHQSGFNQAAGFQDVSTPNVRLTPEAKQEAIAAAEAAIAKRPRG